jgi:hypothetical protein
LAAEVKANDRKMDDRKMPMGDFCIFMSSIYLSIFPAGDSVVGGASGGVGAGFLRVVTRIARIVAHGGFWTAVAERSGAPAFRLRIELPKRRGASLPAAVQEGLIAASLRCARLQEFFAVYIKTGSSSQGVAERPGEFRLVRWVQWSVGAELN